MISLEVVHGAFHLVCTAGIDTWSDQLAYIIDNNIIILMKSRTFSQLQLHCSVWYYSSVMNLALVSKHSPYWCPHNNGVSWESLHALEEPTLSLDSFLEAAIVYMDAYKTMKSTLDWFCYYRPVLNWIFCGVNTVWCHNHNSTCTHIRILRK